LQDKPLRLPNLDLLRLVAALMIVLFHFGYRGPATPGWTPSAFPELAPVAAQMWAGVSFFFILSGFVIAWSAEKRDAYAFLVSRAARVYPAFLACMTLTAVALAVLAPAGVEEFRMTGLRWLANLPLVAKVFGQSFVDGAYWSIVVEVIFYSWVAVFLALGVFHKRQLTVLSAWLAVALVNELALRHAGLQHLLLTRHAGYFALGILAYRAFSAGRRPDLREIAVGICAAAVCLLDDRAYVGWMQATLGYAAPWSPVFAAAKLAAMLLVLTAAIRLPALLPPSACAALGGLTYPVYLAHQNLGYVLMHGLDPALGRWGALGVATTIVLAIAWLVYRYMEPAGRRLILQAGAALRDRSPRARVAASGG
jgi:peptidoglycan/LPS O-acetylase OafA/YrhL